MNISTVTGILILRFGWQMSEGVMSRSVKGFFKLSILTKLLLAKKRLKLGTVLLISIAHFSVHILPLHHYKSDLAHLSDLYSLVIGLYKYKR